MRVPGMAVIPMIQANKTGNTLIVRATRPVVEIIERLVAQNDKPKAEIVFDIEILEVDRNRVKNYGLNLSEYAVGMIFSPETSPSVTVGAGNGRDAGDNNTTTTNTGRSTGAQCGCAAAGLQPEHDFTRRFAGRLVSGGADGDRPLPGIGHEHEDRRQAAASRNRRREVER